MLWSFVNVLDRAFFCCFVLTVINVNTIKIEHKAKAIAIKITLFALFFEAWTWFDLVKSSNNKYKLVDYLFVKLLCGKNIPCEIEISNNSINNIHQLKIVTKKNTIELISKSKDWTNKFMIRKNMKTKHKFDNKS